MRRLVFLAAGLVVSLFVPATALADNGPHEAGASPITDSCAGCHRAHTAQAPHLLKEDQTDLCFSCHGAAGTGSNLDVSNGVGYSSAEGVKRAGGVAGALRGGGFEYALIDSDAASGYRSTADIPTLPLGEKEAVTSTHSINESEQTAWGFGEITGEVNYGKTIKLSCGNCHDPHGSDTYRILRPTPRELFGHGEELPEGAEISIEDPESKVYTTSNYWAAENTNATDFNEKIAAWCTTCHTRYSADHEGSTYSGDPVYSYRHTSNKTGGGSVWRNCAQCHVAHGSNSSMSSKAEEVPFPNPGYSPPAGDSRLLRADNRGVCQLCHGK